MKIIIVALVLLQPMLALAGEYYLAPLQDLVFHPPKPGPPKPVWDHGVAYPKAVFDDFTDLEPTKARKFSCWRQWRANKAGQSNGDLTVKEYFAECERRLQ